MRPFEKCKVFLIFFFFENKSKIESVFLFFVCTCESEKINKRVKQFSKCIHRCINGRTQWNKLVQSFVHLLCKKKTTYCLALLLLLFVSSSFEIYTFYASNFFDLNVLLMLLRKVMNSVRFSWKIMIIHSDSRQIVYTRTNQLYSNISWWNFNAFIKIMFNWSNAFTSSSEIFKLKLILLTSAKIKIF